MKCKGCGYHKNPPGATHCALCGALLGGDDPAVHVGDLRQRGAAKQVETKEEGRPRQDQIVYAGDFAIVYAFVPVNGSLIVLQPGEVFTFGRGDNCDLKIDSKTVSRRHARVHWAGVDPPTPELVDLESKNGITVNGVPVVRKVLEDGDEVAIGPFTATLRVLSANDELRKQIHVDRLGATMISTRRLAGEVKLVPPPWLLGQLERLRESGTLSVQRGEDRGYVSLISGVAIAAGWNDEQTGADAIRAVLRLQEGRFVFYPRADATPQAITQSLGDLLAEVGGGAPAAPARRPGPPPGSGRGGPPRQPPPRKGPPPKPQRPPRRPDDGYR
ncbi:MAG: FHA domain-containing protein [Planctomycetes bacterium]|nr:FHA domain-containing protein [Planctomycetota bacterium]